MVSLYRLWMLLRRLKPDLVEFSTPKAGLLGNMAAWLCGVPGAIYMLRGLKLETATGLKRRILLAAERVAAASAHVVLCNSESLRRGAGTGRGACRSKAAHAGRRQQQRRGYGKVFAGAERCTRAAWTCLRDARSWDLWGG